MTSAAVETAGVLARKIESLLASRGEVYGDPEANLRGVAFGWNWWLKVRGDGPLTSTDVAVMNAIQKLARLAKAPTHQDSALDAAAFVLLAFGLSLGEPQA